MRLAFVATFLMSAVFSSAAFAFTTGAPQMSTNLPSAKPSSFVLIPAFSFGGDGMASFSDDNRANVQQQSASNMEAGLLAEFGRGAFVFQTGMLYMQEGVKYGLETVDQTTNMVNHTDMDGSIRYLGIPLMAKGRVRVAEGLRLSGRAGVMPAFLMGANGTAQTSIREPWGATIAQGPSENIGSDGLRTVNAFAVVGLGPEIRVSRDQNVRIEANYERMLMPMEQYASQKISMQTWNAMLSYGVGF